MFIYEVVFLIMILSIIMSFLCPYQDDIEGKCKVGITMGCLINLVWLVLSFFKLAVAVLLLTVPFGLLLCIFVYTYVHDYYHVNNHFADAYGLAGYGFVFGIMIDLSMLVSYVVL